MIRGEEHYEPRFTCWFGPPYYYAGVGWAANENWDSHLLEIKGYIERRTGLTFNSVMCNLYTDGQESVGWHADNEKHLGRNATIASFSLGCQRKFEMRPAGSKRAATHVFNLEHGDLLIMKGTTQHHWVHRVPKCKATN